MYLETIKKWKGGIIIPIIDTIKLTLNIEDEEIEKFEILERKNDVINYILQLKPKPQICPHCGSIDTIFKEYRKKKLNHSFLISYKTNIVYNIRRYKCINCEKTFYEENRISSGKHRISNLTIINIMDDLKNHLATYKGEAAKYGLSPTTIIKIFDSMLPKIERQTLPEVIGIDEIHIPMVLYNSKYICVMMDLTNNNLTEVLYTRKKDYLSYYFSRISKEERDKVLYFSCDMYDTYISIAERYLKNARICVDPFHVSEHVMKAFSAVRIRKERDLKKDPTARYLFNKFRWLLTKFDFNFDNESKYNRTLGQYVNYRGILRMLLDYDNELETAYNLYLEYHYINTKCTSDNVVERLDNYIKECIHSQIGEFLTLASTLMHYRKYIINSFERYKGRRITNASMESLNGRIDKLVDSGNGYRNFGRFRIRAMYCFNNRIRYVLNENYSTNRIPSKKRKNK